MPHWKRYMKRLNYFNIFLFKLIITFLFQFNYKNEILEIERSEYND